MEKTSLLYTFCVLVTISFAQPFPGDTKITEDEKAIPAAHLFNAMIFDGGTREGDKLYISNIKITNEYR